jgi:hypothetical protein
MFTIAFTNPKRERGPKHPSLALRAGTEMGGQGFGAVTSCNFSVDTAFVLRSTTRTR